MRKLNGQRTKLSLCMIVRDNARTLEACLASIRPYVDEIIVVDTGSTDGTPEIARRYGAIVLEFAWCDDFSAARNESLRLASGEWLFWMDSDDTIPAHCGQKLRTLVDGPHTDETLGYVMQVHCPGPGGASSDEMTVVDHVKLFRNLPGLRFEGRIHEQILPAIRLHQGSVAWTDIYVIHSGAEHTPEARQRKIDRDLRILQLELVERPDHPFVLFNLGMTYNDMGQHATAITWLKRCLSVSQPAESHLRKVYALLVASLSANEQAAEAEGHCREGLALFPCDAELLFRQGIVLHKLGRLPEAAEAYQAALGLKEERHFSSIDPSVAGYKARHNLALVYADIGHPALAELQWRLILEEKQNYAPAWYSLGQSLIEQSKFTTLDVMLESLRDSPEVVTECRLLEAEQALARSDVAKSRAALSKCNEHAPDDMRVKQLTCRYLFDYGPLEEAEAALVDLLRLQPDCPMTLHNLGVVYLRREKWSEASAALRSSLQLRPGAAHTHDCLALVERELSKPV